MKKNVFDAYRLLEKVRSEKPLVHHLTNWVTIYDCASIVKALGASPVMAHAREEAGQMAGLASSLVLNIGTLTGEFIDAMKIAAHSANAKGIPVVFDACGAGATEFRDKKAFELIEETKIGVIKGNVSEIARIAGEAVTTKGVDASDVSADMQALAQALAKKYSCTVVVTGKEDLIADARSLCRVCNGHPMMSAVVGTGCMAASVIGAFCAVESRLNLAAAAALVCFGIAGELAATESRGPASFKEKFIDRIYSLDKETIGRMQRLVC